MHFFILLCRENNYISRSEGWFASLNVFSIGMISQKYKIQRTTSKIVSHHIFDICFSMRWLIVDDKIVQHHGHILICIAQTLLSKSQVLSISLHLFYEIKTIHDTLKYSSILIIKSQAYAKRDKNQLNAYFLHTKFTHSYHALYVLLFSQIHLDLSFLQFIWYSNCLGFEICKYGVANLQTTDLPTVIIKGTLHNTSNAIVLITQEISGRNNADNHFFSKWRW